MSIGHALVPNQPNSQPETIRKIIFKKGILWNTQNCTPVIGQPCTGLFSRKLRHTFILPRNMMSLSSYNYCFRSNTTTPMGHNQLLCDLQMRSNQEKRGHTFLVEGGQFRDGGGGGGRSRTNEATPGSVKPCGPKNERKSSNGLIIWQGDQINL